METPTEVRMSVTVSAEVAERLQDAAIAEHRSRAAQAAHVLSTWATKPTLLGYLASHYDTING